MGIVYRNVMHVVFGPSAILDSFKLDSALSRTVLSSTQCCPGQYSALDNAQPTSVFSGGKVIEKQTQICFAQEVGVRANVAVPLFLYFVNLSWVLFCMSGLRRLEEMFLSQPMFAES